MGWLTVSPRQQSLRQNIHSLELEDTSLSRGLRKFQRATSAEQTELNNAKKRELKDAKSELLEMREERPDTSDAEAYNEWQAEYSDVQDAFNDAKQDINDYYDDLLEQLEEEATDEETMVQDQMSTIEAQLEAQRAELETVNETVKSDIQSSTIFK